MKNLLILALSTFSLIQTNAYAQSARFEWAISMGGLSDAVGYSITTDLSGNVYTTGSFLGIVDFDPGANTFNLNTNGREDIFIQKLDTDGNFIWAQSLGGGFHDYSTSITTDVSGNVYITGAYHLTVDFDAGPNIFNLTATVGSEDVFILKLDSAGNFIWAKSMGGANETDWSNSITTDASENVYITGYFKNTVDFDPGVDSVYLISNGSADIFILKLDSSGNFVWAKSMGGTGLDDGNSINIDKAGNIYVTGGFQFVCDFDPGAGIFNLTAGGGLDAFIQKLDAGGNFIWAKSMVGTSSISPGGGSYGESITTDDNVYVTGSFGDTVDFDPGASTFYFYSKGFRDIFVQKLDTAGNFIWAKSMGGASFDIGRSITTDNLGNVYVTGWFGDTVDFDPGVNTFYLTSNGSNDVFMQKLDASGDFVWAKSAGGKGIDRGESITTNAAGSVYITGIFEDTADFDPGAATFNLISYGQGDIFIQNLSPCAVDVSVMTTDPTITANATGASYQWLDCSSGNTVISGETSRSFTATVNGDYAVEVTKNECTGTSICITITKVGIIENDFGSSLIVYPNPTPGKFNIDLGQAYHDVSVTVSNILGQLISNQHFGTKQQMSIDLASPEGFYLIKIHTGEGKTARLKVMKQ